MTFSSWGRGGGPSVHSPVRPCPRSAPSCPQVLPRFGYWAGWEPGPAVAPFSWGVLEMRRKVVLMAWWQLSISLGTSATVRPLVGMASSTSTLIVPVGGGGISGLGAPASACCPGARVAASLGSRAAHTPFLLLLGRPLAFPGASQGPTRLGSFLDTLVSDGWFLTENK